ncbi:MAG: hypothetical protein BYD32DRAFT_428295, partial [Podila humilis]
MLLLAIPSISLLLLFVSVTRFLSQHSIHPSIPLSFLSFTFALFDHSHTQTHIHSSFPFLSFPFLPSFPSSFFLLPLLPSCLSFSQCLLSHFFF